LRLVFICLNTESRATGLEFYALGKVFPGKIIAAILRKLIKVCKEGSLTLIDTLIRLSHLFIEKMSICMDPMTS